MTSSMECSYHKIGHCERDFLAITWTNLSSTDLHFLCFVHFLLFCILYQPFKKNLRFSILKINVFHFSVLKMSSLKVCHVSAYTTVVKERIACLCGYNHLNTLTCYSNKNPVRRQLHFHSITSVQN